MQKYIKSVEYDDEESKRLGRLFRDGNRQAGLDLLKLHLPLAYSIAARYANVDAEKENTRQNACIGLWKGIIHYDPEMDNTFSTYAVYWIRQQILRGLRQDGPVSIPQDIRTRLNAVNRYKKSFISQHGREPTNEEAAAYFGHSNDDFSRLLSYGRAVTQAGHISFDNPEQLNLVRDSDDGRSAGYSEARSIAKRVLKSGVLLYIFSEKERIVLSARYGLFGHETMTYREIAKKYGYSQTKAMNIERVALRKLREHIVRLAPNREEQRSC